MDTNKDPLRAKYLESKQGDLTAYASMIGDEFASRIDRLAQIIGRSHEQSVGSYKESLLRSFIEKFIPKRYSVGTGFVVFTRESRLNDKESDNVDLWNLKEHYVSRQLDIVIYDDYNFPPILKDQQFVILRPESVRSVIEVKGYLSKASLAEAIDSFIDLGKKWVEYRTYRKAWGHGDLHSPSLHLMGWNVYIDPDGTPQCDGKILRQTIVKRYREALSAEEITARSIPLLSNAYIYADCAVSRCGYVHDGKSGDGYMTNRGKFVRYSEDRTPSLAGDCTIASLLAAIHVSLETPFNPDFSYFDQSMSTKLFAHPCAGLTDITTGEERDA